MANAKKWLAVYTKPRWEKKVHQLLSSKGFESYCPLTKVRRKWSDRTKTIEEPLFKSYVFVKVREDEQTSVRLVNGVVNFIYWLGKPAIIHDKDINTIKRFLNEYDEVIAQPIHLSPSQQVQITGGVLMDAKGKVLKVKGKKVEVLLDCIGYKLLASVDKQHVKVVSS